MADFIMAKIKVVANIIIHKSALIQKTKYEMICIEKFE